MSSSLICSKGKWKSNLQTNKAGGQKTGLREVLGFNRFYCFMTFREGCVFGLHLFWLNDSTCSWTVLRISEKGDGKEWKKKKSAMKYQAIQNNIYQRLSQPKINLDSINFNIQKSIFYEELTLLCQRKTSLGSIVCS